MPTPEQESAVLDAMTTASAVISGTHTDAEFIAAMQSVMVAWNDCGLTTTGPDAESDVLDALGLAGLLQPGTDAFVGPEIDPDGVVPESAVFVRAYGGWSNAFIGSARQSHNEIRVQVTVREARRSYAEGKAKALGILNAMRLLKNDTVRTALTPKYMTCYADAVPNYLPPVGNDLLRWSINLRLQAVY